MSIPPANESVPSIFREIFFSRKNARLKYTVDPMGLENYEAEVALALVRLYTFDCNIFYLFGTKAKTENAIL